jgi:hypothetical protein
MRLGGRGSSFPEHEAGTYTGAGQGITGFFIPHRRTRPGLEGEGNSEETPAFLA